MSEPVLTVSEMVAAEKAAMAAGVSEWDLMLKAGQGAARWVHRAAGGRPVTVLCGPGNNGGDGYVIAEDLRSRGYDVDVIAPVEPSTDTAGTARSRFGGDSREKGRLEHAIVVDCLFGYGLSRQVEGAFRELLEQLSASSCFKIAIDVPSAVRSDCGSTLGPMPRYDLTIALGAWKQAHFLMPSVARMGEKKLVDLGLPFDGVHGFLSSRPVLSAPAADAHKYTRGLVAVVAGEMPGAPLLSCEAAMRAGAGYVKLFSDRSHPDAPADLVIVDNDLDVALNDDRIDALLVGPGLGRGATSRERLAAALTSGRQCVLDADALHLLDDDLMEGVDPSRLLLTPHEGELAALCKSFGVEANGKLDRARSLSAATGLTVLAKGPDTILVGEGTTVFFPQGSSWLSVAGSGDVLAGICAARLAGSRSPMEAAQDAVWLHHEAACLAGPAFTALQLAHCVKPAMASFL
ncbi:NAD(P)H-hydrate dehydratase [Qipengyuania seohaensis]|uniref:NAD(P)H-hydrate dehydratase n=1 Tax=Qipengyuania seohaensis TaxID=266951 RepID=UPI001E4F5AA4|nr:NAD(P)H-hydrate dehydratase [Qipengyuania seohaensis]